MPMRVGDRSMGHPWREKKLPLERSKVVFRNIPSHIEVSLNEWEKRGIRINISVGGLGLGTFNRKRYPNRKTAEKKFAHVVEQVEKGNYIVEVYENDEIKLRLTNPK